MTDKFDSIVVGAGPAGCAAAYHMAAQGLRVLVIERGEYPGSKNVSGAILHTHALAELFPDFLKEAPLERIVTNRKLALMTPETSLTLDFKDEHFAEPPYNGFTVLRSKFDPWLAKKTEDAGALIMTSTRVDELLWDKDKVVGVRTGKIDGDVRADAVIIAEGANSILTQKARLRGDLPPGEMAVAAKEVIKLSKQTIDERFNLTGNQGASIHFIGDCTKGISGGGFLYTNQNSISLGLVCKVSELAERKLKISDLVERFKAHPHVHTLIKGGVLKEYSGHMIPEGGFKQIPRLFADGILVTGEAASLNFNNGFIMRGMDYALASGTIAAKTVCSAKAKGDFSRDALAAYQRELENSFVLKDMKRFSGLPDVLSNPRVFSTYPDLLCGLGRDMFEVDGRQRKSLLSMIGHARRRAGKEAGIGTILLDLIKTGGKI